MPGVCPRLIKYIHTKITNLLLKHFLSVIHNIFFYFLSGFLALQFHAISNIKQYSKYMFFFVLTTNIRANKKNILCIEIGYYRAASANLKEKNGY